MFGNKPVRRAVGIRNKNKEMEQIVYKVSSETIEGLFLLRDLSEEMIILK
jgi:hypothetical protein